jgi:integrase
VARHGGIHDRAPKTGGVAARAIEFVIQTAARSGEVRGATWAEVDVDAATWIVPAERMKSGREHRVPLTTALDVLRTVKELVPENSFIFPGPAYRRGDMFEKRRLMMDEWSRHCEAG